MISTWNKMGEIDQSNVCADQQQELEENQNLPKVEQRIQQMHASMEEEDVDKDKEDKKLFMQHNGKRSGVQEIHTPWQSEHGGSNHKPWPVDEYQEVKETHCCTLQYGEDINKTWRWSGGANREP